MAPCNIAFQCLMDKKRKVIGRSAKELCDTVLEAIASGDTVSTKFAWVKYIIVSTTGPGYYAAIDITRKWSPFVQTSVYWLNN